MVAVPLTAVAPSKRQLGEQAAHMLLDRLDHTAEGEEPLALRQVTVKPTLTVRRSRGQEPGGPGAAA